MEPSEAQFLIVNALDALELLESDVYDRETGIWYIKTPSPSLPVAQLMFDGEVVPVNAEPGR
ncbi:hypothetical protein [Gloeobacter morelensis]|uniref:Uncharacterized protein n=1 Tax=Gloeobacter morelensis MG652769 TaxID=2781736 RepID=A0ABY3PPZ1_9CYAN|nr:hypothetical protein [Gloeobacter morelensis]UFP95780.1 hypothetical protein ISF26_05985 [Gloeobacter morelensis MG652769]